MRASQLFSYYYSQLGGEALPDWILATGFWDDSGLWDDTASWID